MKTDDDWRRWGRDDPYFGVLTHEKFRRVNLTEERKAEFLETGHAHVDHVLGSIRRWIDPSFAPSRALDFGCGVGRVLIPLARLATEVVGVDVSEEMLAEASRNCAAADARGVRLVRSDDRLSEVEGTFDLVHSCIVLQHIPAARGLVLFRHLLDRIRPGGVGAIQLTYGWSSFPEHLGRPPPPQPEPPPRTPVHAWLRRRRSVVERAPLEDAPADPDMQMHAYDLSDIHFLLHAQGIGHMHTEMTDHGGALGTFMFFQRPV